MGIGHQSGRVCREVVELKLMMLPTAPPSWPFGLFDSCVLATSVSAAFAVIPRFPATGFQRWCRSPSQRLRGQKTAAMYPFTRHVGPRQSIDWLVDTRFAMVQNVPQTPAKRSGCCPHPWHLPNSSKSALFSSMSAHITLAPFCRQTDVAIRGNRCRLRRPVMMTFLPDI